MRFKVETFDKKWRLVIIIFALIIVGFFVDRAGYLSWPKNIAWQMAKPVGLIMSSSVGRVPNFFKNLFHLQTILKQNHDLVNENLLLQSRLASLSEVSYENEILKKELGFSKKEVSADLTPAAVIGQSPGYLGEIVIDKGKNVGLEAGQAVVSQGFLIGIVTEVRQNNSEVKLISDYNSLIPVVSQDSRGTGLLRGGLQGLIIEDIPLNIVMKANEKITTSGLGGQFPAGIAIGTVGEIVSDKGEIFQKASVSSPIDFSKLEVIFVMKKNE